MKRASLSSVPLTSRTEPSDLTDRLLQPEAVALGSGQGAPDGKARRARKSTPPPAAAAEYITAIPDVSQQTSGTRPPPDDAPISLDEALKHAEAATAALRQAARSGQARFELGLRYRLDALAHHVRQVAEYVAASSQK